MKVAIIAEYPCSVTSEVELKEGKTWADVEEWYIKWGDMVITYKDGTVQTVSVDGDLLDGVDKVNPFSNSKRPTYVEVLALDEDGMQTGLDLDSEGG